MAISALNYAGVLNKSSMYNKKTVNDSYKAVSNEAKSKVSSVNDIKDDKQSELEKKITAMAKKDAANGIYMDKEFSAFRKAYVAEVSPDRGAAIAQVMSKLNNEKQSFELSCDPDPWITMLLGLDYKAEGVYSESGHPSAEIYNEGNELIASYNWQSGWTSVSTKAETARHEEVKMIYYQAYHEARQQLNGNSYAAGSLINIEA